jgi:VWFA-related protein
LTAVLASCLCGLILVSSAGAKGGAQDNGPDALGAKKEQPAGQESPNKETAIRVTSNIVTAPVTVMNSEGEFVYDLQPKDFEVLDNGVPQHIEQFSLEMHALATVIVVEANSTSDPLLDEIRPLGPLFSGLLVGPQGEAALITYGDRIRVLQELSRDGDGLESAMRGLVARGSSSHLNDALARAVSILEVLPKGMRRVIVVFSDGHDIGSETRKEELVQRAVNAEIAIYGVGFSPARAFLARQSKEPAPSALNTNMARPLAPNTAPTPTNASNTYDWPTVPPVPLLLATGEMAWSTLAKTSMEFFAGYTGGVCYEHWSRKAVQDELNRIADEIHSQYEIAYVPHAPSNHGFHRIEVRVARNGVKVRARAGYFMGDTNK